MSLLQLVPSLEQYSSVVVTFKSRPEEFDDGLPNARIIATFRKPTSKTDESEKMFSTGLVTDDLVEEVAEKDILWAVEEVFANNDLKYKRDFDERKTIEEPRTMTAMLRFIEENLGSLFRLEYKQLYEAFELYAAVPTKTDSAHNYLQNQVVVKKEAVEALKGHSLLDEALCVLMHRICNHPAFNGKMFDPPPPSGMLEGFISRYHI